MKNSTYRIYIEDAEEKVTPPREPVLELGIVGENLYISIGEMQESTMVRTFKAEAVMAVDVVTLLRHIETLVVLELGK